MLRLITSMLLAACLTLADTAGLSQDRQTEPAKSEDAAVAKIVPMAAIAPWRTLGVDPSIRARLKDSLALVLDTFTKKYLSDTKTLTALAIKQKSVLPINLRHRSDDIIVGNLKNPLSEPIIIEPVICSFADYYLFFILIKDMAENTLSSSGHSAVKRNEIIDEKNKLNAAPIAPAIEQAAVRAWQRLSSGIADKKTALKIGFSSGFENTRIDEASSQCLNLLLAENLAPRYRIVANIGNESTVTLRRVIPIEKRMQRATRQLINYWKFVAKENEQHLALPLTVQLRSTAAEAVYASTIPVIFEHNYDLGPIKDGELPLIIDSKLESFFSEEKIALATTDMPKISKIDRAWAYVDRGRAWGLKMDDRLTLDTDGKTIKGHVVGYFGPELALKSPDGHPIYEGAIIYIRKGQRDIKIGQTLQLDKKTFPTPWPPTAAQKQAK